MTDIVFVRTRYFYQSYTDFWRLVELSGFPTCFVDEVDISKHITYIVSPMNGEWRPHIDNQKDRYHNAHLILWCLERPSPSELSYESGVGNYGRSNRQLIYDRYVDEVWVSDRRLAQETGARFVVLGSDYGLGEPGGEKRYSFVHMSYVVPRRDAVYSQFISDEIIAPNCWPPHRNTVMQSSKFALNIHQDQYPFQEPLRLALFAAYGLPILTETIHDAYPWSEECMVSNPYDGIVGRMRQMLENDYDRWRSMGLKARDRMCGEFNFKKMVLEAVK